MSRFYVSELEGYPDATAKRSEPGLSCMVIDSLICKQVMATYCTEDLWQEGRSVKGIGTALRVPS